MGVSNCRSFDKVRGWARDAQEAGIRTVFISEDIGCRDAFQLAAVSVRETASVHFTIAVANPYQRSPIALLEALSTLDELSGGRITLGLGSSSRRQIWGQLGQSYGRRVHIMRETVACIRRTFCSLSNRPPRLAIAAMGPQMLRLAGELADEVILNTGTTPRYVGWARRHVLEGADRAGRDPSSIAVAVWVPVYIDDDRRQAVLRARRWAARMLSIPEQGELLLQQAGLSMDFLPHLRQTFQAYPSEGDVEAAAPIIPEEAVERLAVIVRTPEEAAHRLQTYRDLGVTTVVVGPGPAGRLAVLMSGA
ncbi:MAG TPA: LLM class flavin-dependent oxidoreductase [Chloroflexota bacterium]|nr:LLM class flavin-dependent oxidoreductase [Chloroflexota bacterium]